MPDEDAQPWDSIFRREGRVYLEPAPVVIRAAERMQQHGCRRVLDLGCGTGRHTVSLAERGFTVTGLDNSPTALAMTQAWLAEKRLEATLVRADMRRPLPLRSESMDGLVSTQVIHHARLATVQGTARELTRILRRGAMLFVTVPAGPDEGETLEQIEPGTFVPTVGSEKGLPHHFFTATGLARLFPDFDPLEQELIEDRILTLLAVRR